jgi:putative transcriptional regulator
MVRKELLRGIREILTNAGFYVSDLHSIRLTGFDIVARRDNTLLIIKVLSNIDSLSEDVANELRTLSSLLKAIPLLIGEKKGSSFLEDDIAYFRFGIQVITQKTLENHLLEGIPINSYAAPGGFYVNIDEEKLRKLRQEKNISIGTLARFVNVSRRAIRMYEDGMNSRIEVANRIEQLLESSITIPINLLDTTYIDNKIKVTYGKEAENIKAFQREIFTLLQSVGYKIIPMDRCPFEALSKNREKILLTCVHKYNKKLLKKAQIVSSISKITEKYAVIFTDRDINEKNVEGTPIIIKKELKKVCEPEEIFDLIMERI